MNIPFVDLKAQYRSIKGEIEQAIDNVISETAFIGGKYVKEFELKFSSLYGVKYCVPVANGTDSLYIIMKMLGIGVGDEVITSAYSWISSSETISQTGAVPVFVDVDPVYYSIDEGQIEDRITSRTKAIIPVHIHGQACDMDSIIRIAEKYNLFVIEDCAQSHFSEYKGKRAGTMGIASSFSFYPGKNLGAYGDAGCILTDMNDLQEKCRMYASHGALKKHHHIIEGINSRMDGIQASILLAKLPFILDWTERRREVASWYDIRLAELDFIDYPRVRPNSKHSYHLYVIRVNRRDELVSYLKNRGIETVIHYPTALPNLPCYDYLNHRHEYPVATKNQGVMLSLPIYPEMTEDMVSYVVDAITQFYQ